MSTILVISPEPWSGHFVSKHHYAQELARRGHDVLFHGPPEAAGPMRLVPVTEAHGRLWVLHAPRVAPGLRFLPGPLRRALEARWLGRVQKLVDQHIDVVWNFENSRFYEMRFAGARLKIYQQVDLNQDFHAAKAAATADLSIAVSGPIERRLVATAKKLIRVTHGYAEHPMSGDMPDGFEAGFKRPSVNAVLVGNLDIAYLDISLLAQLVAAHPEVRFHFVGKYSVGSGLHGEIGSAPNTVFWGRQPSSALPAFLSCADILLVAYLAEGHLEQLANPHKMMEYLASGRVVLATRTLEYEERLGLIEIARSRQEFLARFRVIVSQIDKWNSAEKMRVRQEFALANSYSRQMDRIVDALGERGHQLLGGVGS